MSATASQAKPSAREATRHPAGIRKGERLAGWLDALTAAGITPLLVNQPDDFSAESVAAARMLRRPDRPTAVLCLTDVIARAGLPVRAPALVRVNPAGKPVADQA